MRQPARNHGTPFAAGCLLAALALALLSLATGTGAAHRPVRSAPRAAVAQPSNVARAAHPGLVDAAAGALARFTPAAPSAVPYALLPTALLFAAALGMLDGRLRRTDRSARPHRGVPTGRAPPGRLLAACLPVR